MPAQLVVDTNQTFLSNLYGVGQQPGNAGVSAPVVSLLQVGSVGEGQGIMDVVLTFHAVATGLPVASVQITTSFTEDRPGFTEPFNPALDRVETFTAPLQSPVDAYFYTQATGTAQVAQGMGLATGMTLTITASYSSATEVTTFTYTVNGAAAALGLGFAGDGDQITLGGGSDFFCDPAGTATILGGGGNDTLMADGGGADWLDGGSGNDLISYKGFDSALYGGTGNDVVDFTGSNAGWAGHGTRLNGGAGNDSLEGNAGADSFTEAGVSGNDTLVGGGGVDKVSYAAAPFAITLSLVAGTATSAGNGGNDVLSSIEQAVGTAFGDVLDGAASANRLDGLAGNDTLRGFEGNDGLSGGDGVDLLTGGNGADMLTGGAGNDLFDFNLTSETRSGAGFGTDTIVDFGQGAGNNDRVDLRGIDANTQVTGNQAFSFTANGGLAAFSGQPGALRWVPGASQTLIYLDTNGDNLADATLRLTGVYILAGSDFLL